LPNIASVLKDEIVRLSRRELRGATNGLKKTSGQYRSDIAALKKRVTSIERQLTRIEKLALIQLAESSVPVTPVRVRFSAKRLQAQRLRLGLSAADAGFLMNVSAQTIYNWEDGKTRPDTAQITAITLGIRNISPVSHPSCVSGWQPHVLWWPHFQDQH